MSAALPQVLGEPALVALYHTAEHLAVSAGNALSEAKDWQAKRNVLGSFDGRPLKILRPNTDGSGQNLPEGYQNVGMISFLVHRLGEVAVSARGRAVSFDISFDDEAAVSGTSESLMRRPGRATASR